MRAPRRSLHGLLSGSAVLYLGTSSRHSMVHAQQRLHLRYTVSYPVSDGGYASRRSGALTTSPRSAAAKASGAIVSPAKFHIHVHLLPHPSSLEISLLLSSFSQTLSDLLTLSHDLAAFNLDFASCLDPKAQ